MQQQHLFIMDPLEKLNFKLDSSLQMVCELLKLGHQCYFSMVQDLSWDSRYSSPGVSASLLKMPNFNVEEVAVENPSLVQLRDFNAIHMRKEPPFDLTYITATWLLDEVANDVKIFNDPNSLRSFNEKLGILQFKESIEPAFVSSRAHEMLAFIKQACHGDAIIKPLDLYGGKGIFRLNLRDMDDKTALVRLKEASSDGALWRMVQPFKHQVFEGEVRAFTLGGEILSWCLKKPLQDSFLANTGAGATIHPYKPSQNLIEHIEKIAQNLYQRGVAITAFDIIGETVSEINITSPRLLKPQSDQTNYYHKMARWFEKQCL